jgi:hypothetical protein
MIEPNRIGLPSVGTLNRHQLRCHDPLEADLPVQLAATASEDNQALPSVWPAFAFDLAPLQQDRGMGRLPWKGSAEIVPGP